MAKLTIVVLSRYPEIFEPCRKRLAELVPEVRKVLVLDRSQKRGEAPVVDRFDTHGWNVIRVEMPFSMARNGSIGLMAAWPDDVLYMGDDVLIERAGDIEFLHELVYRKPNIGIVSPRVAGACGNHDQRYPGKGIYEDYAFCTSDFVFPCVLLNSRMIEEIGYLDMRFSGYGGDDIDYVRRVKAAGWKLVVTDKVIVKHGFGPYDGTATFQMRETNTVEEAAAASRKMEEKAWEVNSGFRIDSN